MLDLTSHVEGIVWPPFPGQEAMAVQAILFQLEHSQWYSTAQIEALQRRQLLALIKHAREAVPFYRDRLAGFDLERFESFDDEAWRAVPRLVRTEIQDAGDGIYSKKVPRSHGRIGTVFTSGSTGKPIRVLRTQMAGFYRSALTMRDHIWHRRDMTGKLAALRDATKGKHVYPEGTVANGWSGITRSIFRNGPGVGLNVNTPVPQQVEWLQRHDPDYILGFPTIIRSIAEYCIEHGITFGKLKQVETISEVLPPDVRELCQRAWGVKAVDLYSSRDVGYLALECPEHPVLHVSAETTLLEVLDEEGRRCKPGEIGKVVVTPLQNFAMPLIRYEIGDYAEVGEPCACGRGLPVLKRVMGRVQNQVRLPDGVTRWPLLTTGDIESLLEIAPIRQYQIVQKSYETMEVRLVCDPPLDAAQTEKLDRWVAEKFHRPFEVELRYFEEIPRTASGKFFDFLCEVT